MLSNVMGIMNLVEAEDDIFDLTRNRSIASIPFGGRYRIVDFTLSNMVNAGIYNIGIFISHKYKSLQDHIGTGTHWDLDRKNGGLTLFQPYGSVMSDRPNLGDVSNFKNNLAFLEKSKQEYVLLSRSYMITSIDFEKVYEEHIKSGADVTLVCKNIDCEELREKFLNLDQVEISETGVITSKGTNLGHHEKSNISLEMYLMKKSLFYDIVVEAYEKGSNNTIKEALFSKHGLLKFHAYIHDKEVRCVNSLQNYYNTSMDLLNPNYYSSIFDGEGGKVYTKTKDEPSTLYDAGSNVRNSVIANGCIIEGTVENSILFRGVTVKKGAVVKDSIIMQGSTVNENSTLECCILDKEVTINKNKRLVGDKSRVFTITKGSTI